MAVADHYKEIPPYSRVVFDWDNTLKIVNREEKRIECSVPKTFLHSLVKEKKCQLYIISAIRPSRMNMDTLLMEVDRLEIRDFFCPSWQSQQHSIAASKESKLQSCPPRECFVEVVQGKLDTYVRWGNIAICGYDKAEVFLEMVAAEEAQLKMSPAPIVPGGILSVEVHTSTPRRYIYECEVEDDVDSLFEDNSASGTETETESSASKEDSEQLRHVVFFDDEEVNILNFGNIVQKSLCIWVH